MAYQPDKTTSEILASLQSEENYGILIAAQLGGTPQELQLILQTAAYEEETGGFNVLNQYIIRAISVVEHRLALGLFKNMVISESNPLLYRHNEPLLQIYFRGVPEDVDTLMLDISQLYGQTYGPHRNLAEEINTARPLAALLSAGYGYLGEMPAPFARTVGRLMEKQGMKANFVESEPEEARIPRVLLALDDSYFIAQLFSADPMARRKGE